MNCVAEHHLLFFMRVLKVDFEDLMPPIDHQNPDFYSDLDKLMNRRF